MCGESWLAIKESLIHHPSSQGWASGVHFCFLFYFILCFLVLSGCMSMDRLDCRTVWSSGWPNWALPGSSSPWSWGTWIRRVWHSRPAVKVCCCSLSLVMVKLECCMLFVLLMPIAQQPQPDSEVQQCSEAQQCSEVQQCSDGVCSKMISGIKIEAPLTDSRSDDTRAAKVWTWNRLLSMHSVST